MPHPGPDVITAAIKNFRKGRPLHGCIIGGKDAAAACLLTGLVGVDPNNALSLLSEDRKLVLVDTGESKLHPPCDAAQAGSQGWW